MNDEHVNSTPGQMGYLQQAPAAQRLVLQTLSQNSSFTRREVQDDRDDLELLRGWKQVFRKEFSWRPILGHTVTVRSGKHKSPTEARIEAREMALEMGYRPPRIIEFWRWGEERLP